MREYLQAYDRTAAIAGVTLARKLTDDLKVSAGLQFEQAYIVQEEVGRSYSLLQAAAGRAVRQHARPVRPDRTACGRR